MLPSYCFYHVDGGFTQLISESELELKTEKKIQYNSPQYFASFLKNQQKLSTTNTSFIISLFTRYVDMLMENIFYSRQLFVLTY